MTTATMSISLPDQLKKKIHDRIAESDFSNPSDYVRHLVRQDLEKQKQQIELVRLIQEGIDSGISSSSTDEIFDELRRYIRRRTA